MGDKFLIDYTQDKRKEYYDFLEKEIINSTTKNENSSIITYKDNLGSTLYTYDRSKSKIIFYCLPAKFLDEFSLPLTESYNITKIISEHILYGFK